MTPFDAIALLVMLLTWYPVVSVATLQRARLERPAYFAGGVLFGTKGEKLRLPDGRVFDIISGTSGSHPQWWVGEVTGDPEGEPDPYPLEDGPLRPVDDVTWPRPLPASDFESLAAAAVAELTGADVALGTQETTVGEQADPTPLEYETAGDVETVEAQLGGQAAVLEALDPDELLRQSAVSDGFIAGETGDWNALEVGDIPEAPTPPFLPSEPPEDPRDPTEPPIEQ